MCEEGKSVNNKNKNKTRDNNISVGGSHSWLDLIDNKIRMKSRIGGGFSLALIFCCFGWGGLAEGKEWNWKKRSAVCF